MMKAMPDATVTHLTLEQLHAGLDPVRDAPRDEGRLEMIVRRPGVGQREVLDEGMLDAREGLVGDSWQHRGSSRTPDGSPHPDMQINVMSARAVALVAGDRSRWPLAGDQLFVDLDLSEANMPAGTRLHIGEAVLEVTPQPHTGCAKFVERFGLDAMKFVNSPVGRELHLRGINARVVTPGVIRAGDRVRVTRPAS
jgi:MOSC domain-containing protein YiiM